MKIAILSKKNKKVHSTNWSQKWIEYCNEKNINYEVCDPFDNSILDKLSQFDIVLWHYDNYSYEDMLIAKNILFSLDKLGVKTFPTVNDSWHFDDKLAETYLLQAIDAPIPKTYYFYSHDDLKKYIHNLRFPIIFKLRNGSGSHNIKLINSKQELLKYSRAMFTKGISSSPSLLYKASSNIKSSRNLQTFISRAKRIPEFLMTLSNSKKFNMEKGYVYLQEHIENDGFDLKIVVIGDKLSFFGRNIRKGEFRASGGGDMFYNKELIPLNVIRSAFETSEKLGFTCMGYDYVIDKNSNNGLIIEISYGFSYESLIKAGGYFDKEGNWFDQPLDAPIEVLMNLIKEINSKSSLVSKNRTILPKP